LFSHVNEYLKSTWRTFGAVKLFAHFRKFIFKSLSAKAINKPQLFSINMWCITGRTY